MTTNTLDEEKAVMEEVNYLPAISIIQPFELDLNKHRVIRNHRRLHDMYWHGTDTSTFMFVMGKN